MNSTAKSTGLFVLSLTLCYLAAGVGSVATIQSIPTWYVSIHKPSFNPPNWLFGPVWTVLYTFMAISFYLILRSAKEGKNKVAVVFILQLALNTAWSFIFFYYHQIGWALVEIICLEVLLVYYIFVARPFSKWASNLFVPYVLWVGFASVLNFSIWLLNR